MLLILLLVQFISIGDGIDVIDCTDVCSVGTDIADVEILSYSGCVFLKKSLVLLIFFSVTCKGLCMSRGSRKDICGFSSTFL